MNERPIPPELPPRRAPRSRALPWVLLAIGLCVTAGIGVALLVPLVSRRPEEPVPGPLVTIRIGWAAASPEEVEQHLSIPVEERLDRVTGAVTVCTEARVGECAVEVQFASGIEESTALDSVRRAIEAVSLPAEVDRPEILILAGPGDRTVLLVFSGGTLRELLRGVGVVRERLSRDPGVRGTETIGVPREIVRVEVDQHAPMRYGIPLNALLGAVRESARMEPDAEPGAGGVAAALDELVLLMHGETPVYLRDVAMIKVSTDEPTSAAFGKDGPVMLIRVVYRAGVDAPLLQGDVSGLADALLPDVQVQARLADEADDHLLFLHWRAPAAEAVPVLREVAHSLLRREEVTEMIAWLSPREDHRALLRTGVPARDFAPILVGLLNELPGIALLGHPDPARQTLTLDVHLEDGQDLAGLVEELRTLLRSLDGVEFVAPGLAPANPEFKLVVDRERTAALGIPPDSVAEQFALFSTGQEVGTVGGLPVVVRLEERARRSGDLTGLRISSPSGAWVPLAEVASLELVAPPRVIRRVSGRRTVTLSLVPAAGADPEKVLANARAAVRE